MPGVDFKMLTLPWGDKCKGRDIYYLVYINIYIIFACVLYFSRITFCQLCNSKPLV